jgi:NADH dehydrogenase
MKSQKRPHVVIVGGGFGGLTAAKALSRKGIKLSLVDKHNYHLFQPLLYQVAMAGLSPAEIAYPLRSLLGHRPDLEILLGEVLEVNKEEKWLRTEANVIAYDYLVLACGSTYTYFNSPQWEAFAPGLKTIEQATEIRRKVFLAFEKAERERDPVKQHHYQTFVIVGGGPTGVELAGTLGEIVRYSLVKDFDHINVERTKIILVEAGPAILPTMTKQLQNEAVLELEELGVEVRTGTKVIDVNDLGIKLNDEFIYSSTVLWAAGVGASPLNQHLGVELDKQGRVLVNSDCTVPGFDSIYVIGDQAHYEWGEESKPLPGLAPVAMQQGRFVARHIHRRIDHLSLPSFKYVDKGQMATIGRSRAVAMFKGIEFYGFTAWLAWLLVHIYYLIGFKNRLVVLFNWAWTYLTYRRGVRLIIDPKGLNNLPTPQERSQTLPGE